MRFSGGVLDVGDALSPRHVVGAAADRAAQRFHPAELHASVAVEKLAKAVLVSKNLVYIAEIRNNSADMVLYVGGHLQVDEEKVRTVGAMEAIKRLRKINLLQPAPSSTC